MDSSPTSSLPPPPDPNPNPTTILPHHHTSTDINPTLSTLKHLIHLSKSTITSLSTTLPTTLPTTTTTTTTTVPCPYKSNHRLPPTSLFRHHLHCPSSPAPIDLSLIHSLHYPSTLQSPTTTPKHNYPSNTDLSIPLTDYYHTSLHSNFFYLDCPSVVSFPHDVTNNNINNRMITLPSVLSAECADASVNDNNDDVADVIGVVKLLPSEYYNVRVEISHWNDYGHDYPAVYSHGVCRSFVCCYLYYKEESLMEWILVNSSYYGVVINVHMRDHIFVLFRVCLKAIAREATGYLVLISRGERAGGDCRFECPVLVRVMMWLASQFGILYGEVNGKLFAINMLKQALLTVSLKSVMFYDEPSGLNSYDGETESVNGSKEIDGRGRKRVILVSQVAAAVAALHECSAFETRIKAIRASRFVPAYQRVQEHEYISKVADEERKKRPNYRPIIEHDGVLWHRGGNQDLNKNKSQEELLAEERDYKRRRMSYRGKKIKRSTTQVMGDIIDEYMEEIKRANMAGQPSADESKPSSMSNLRTDKHKHDDINQKTVFKESASDISMRSSRYEGDVKEKSSKHRHKDNRSSTRTKDRSSSPNNRHKSKRKDRSSSSILPNEFEDRYDPSNSRDFD
ncbi:U11/U12 small nuclear ribonucleoprotein 48 kDa protein-like [Bidens hawaiensis]|uniref:U11/U12 small nuclear ribonucleoprotein 48 kDa protein-like n=1 Tax=Bidens hawaiensis TaxID=980011 RepID=UPI00404A7575